MSESVLPMFSSRSFIVSGLPVPKTLCSINLEILVPERKMLPPGDRAVIPLNWKLKLVIFGSSCL